MCLHWWAGPSPLPPGSPAALRGPWLVRAGNPARCGGMEAHLWDTVGVQGLDLGGNPEKRVEEPDSVDLGSNNQLES